MVSQDKIEKLAALLGCRGITTLDDLRSCISQDIETGVHWTSVTTGASQGLLLALLIAEATDDGAKRSVRGLDRYWRSLRRPTPLGSLPGRVWHGWKKHVPDVLAFGLVVLVLIGIVFVVLRAASLERGAQHVAVKDGTSLPAFHQLRDDELEMKSTPGVNGSFTSFDQVRGRYTLAAIPASTMLQPNQLLSLQLSTKLKDRRIMTVALKPTAYSATLAPPCEALMILSPRSPDAKVTGPAPFEVIVLSIDTVGESKSCTLALGEDKFAIVAPLLASHDVFLTQTAR